MIGTKKALITGILFTCLSVLIISFDNLTSFGIICFIIGSGISLCNYCTFLSLHYSEEDARRYGGFIILLASSTLGLIVSTCLVNVPKNLFSIDNFYLIAVLSLVFSLIILAAIFNIAKSYISISNRRFAYDKKNDYTASSVFAVLIIIACCVKLIIAIKILVFTSIIIFMILGVLSASYMIFYDRRVAHYESLWHISILLIIGLLGWFCYYSFILIMLNDHQTPFNVISFSSNVINIDYTMTFYCALLIVAVLILLFTSKKKTATKYTKSS